MASVTKRKNGSWQIQFFDSSGKRKYLYVPKMPKSAANEIKNHIEHLISSAIARTALGKSTSEWVSECGDVMRTKLSKLGLIDALDSVTLSQAVSRYIKSRVDVKGSTKIIWRRYEKWINKYFGVRSIQSITIGDAKDFRQFLLKNDLAENTTRKTCSFASQIMNDARDRNWITQNSFSAVPKTTKSSTEKQRFIDRETITKVIENCPDDEWKLIIALSRYGGLRCPSEVLALRWENVMWEEGKILVPSPKTEHHEGKENRLIPLFPELKPYLETVRNDDAEFVINRYRSHKNLGTQLKRIIWRAEIAPWPRPFHNLRATRETELAETFPIQVVCAWIGNTTDVAMRSYLQVTEEHFKAASANTDTTTSLDENRTS